jgi:mRNA-degrading endonuclease RelE of RelBE toxin-antitoxin system
VSSTLRGFPFEIETAKSALKDFAKLDSKMMIRVQEAINTLALTGVGDVQMLEAPFDDAWRLRVGKYRVKFELEGGVISILGVEKREDAYRKGSRKS